VLKTPHGKIAHTTYLPVAEKLMKDWEELGYETYNQAWSLLGYHFTMVEYFSQIPNEKLIVILNDMHWENDWTFKGCPIAHPEVIMEWITYFGKADTQVDIVREWLGNQTNMQLTASTCIRNAFGSYNVAYHMAVVVELIPEEEHEENMRDFYDFYSIFDPSYGWDFFWAIFECFRLYYGIHFKEDGNHLPKIVD